jgi:ribosomal protein S18 acetylase RimI-like enzyme
MVVIRPGTPQDDRLLAEIGAETFHDSFAADNTPEDMHAYISASFGPEQQALELADPQSKFLIAELNGEVVGYSHLKFEVAPHVNVGNRPVEIARFYSRKQWIGKGVGARLMEKCLKEAVAAECDAIWLGVWEINSRAIAFYRKWGFCEAGKQTFQLGNDLQQDLLMVRFLE